MKHDFRLIRREEGGYGGERMGSVDPDLWYYQCNLTGEKVVFNGCVDGKMMRLHDSDYAEFMRILNEGRAKEQSLLVKDNIQCDVSIAAETKETPKKLDLPVVPLLFLLGLTAFLAGTRRT